MLHKMRPALPSLPSLLALAPLALGACAGLSEQRALVSALDREVLALKVQNELLTERLKTCATDTAAPTLYAELHQLFSDTELSVTREGAVVVLLAPSRALFLDGGVKLHPDSARTLDLVATSLSLHPEFNLLIVSHTDDKLPPGSQGKGFPSVWELSAARAAALARALSETYGVAPERLTIAGQGGFSPIADNSTPEGREQNRRVELRFVPAPRQEPSP